MEHGTLQPYSTNKAHKKIIFNHNRELIFEGGNEYRKFEILDVERPSMGVESIYWDGVKYCADLWTDEPRRNYIYDEDANGHFYIRNSDTSKTTLLQTMSTSSLH